MLSWRPRLLGQFQPRAMLAKLGWRSDCEAGVLTCGMGKMNPEAAPP